MNNILTIKYAADGGIVQMDDVKLFKLCNGVTTIRAICPFAPAKI